MIETTKTVDRNSSEIKVHDSPFAGWEWLKTPACLLILTGVLGLVREYGRAAAIQLDSLRFPPVWGCCVLIAAGMIFLTISLTAYRLRRNQPINASKRKYWRSL